MTSASNILSGLSVTEAIGQFFAYAMLALLAENIVFSRALGVTRVIKLVNDPEVETWEYCIPVILVQLLAMPWTWTAHFVLFPWLRGILPEWLPIPALRPLVYISCASIAMLVVWLLLGIAPAKKRAAFRAQLPMATFNCGVIGTLLITANQNYTMVQSVGFGLGSGLGYLLAVLVVDEGRRRLLSKDVPTIFKGLPSALIYIGILSLAIYGLLGHNVTI